MIVFKFDEENEERTFYWLGCTSCIGDDERHTVEIYEQLDAETCGLAGEI